MKIKIKFILLELKILDFGNLIKLSNFIFLSLSSEKKNNFLIQIFFRFLLLFLKLR